MRCSYTKFIREIVTSAENNGFDSFWVMDHFHQIPMIGKPEEPMLESWTTSQVIG
jgi:alkanesulfonate monooxygenase SsuD/methylene tetrahydromethanopterin reductase-like flavin-dependent oxidoreductase (luciferase family)